MQKNTIKILFVFSILIGITSCASVKKKDEKLSLCNCLKMIIENPELKDKAEPPKGCEWLKDLDEEEGQKLFMNAMTECPDLMQSLMEGAQPANEERAIEEENE